MVDDASGAPLGILYSTTLAESLRAGAALEEVATRKPGVEVTVRLENGRVIAVVQEDQGEGFRVGERVRVVNDGGTTRVAR